MNIFLNEYFGFCFELNFELNHFWAKFNEKMNFQNVSNRASQAALQRPSSGRCYAPEDPLKTWIMSLKARSPT